MPEEWIQAGTSRNLRRDRDHFRTAATFWKEQNATLDDARRVYHQVHARGFLIAAHPGGFCPGICSENSSRPMAWIKADQFYQAASIRRNAVYEQGAYDQRMQEKSGGGEPDDDARQVGAGLGDLP